MKPITADMVDDPDMFFAALGKHSLEVTVDNLLDADDAGISINSLADELLSWRAHDTFEAAEGKAYTAYLAAIATAFVEAWRVHCEEKA